MRILAFSDVHRSRSRAEQIVDHVDRYAPDLVIGAGDFSSFGRGLRGIVDVLAEITAPTILVSGNHERPDELRDACQGWKSATVLHGEGAHANGSAIWGVGGAVPPTPFPWGFDVREEDAEALLTGAPAGGILVSHSPPLGFLDRALGRHLGSRAVLAAIERTRPRLVVCGHIHQAAGRETTVGCTRVVNPGPRVREIRL